MRPRKAFAEGAADRLEALMREAGTKAEFQRAQSLWLRAALEMPVTEIARAVLLAPNTVRVLHSRYLREGEEALAGPGRGGRRRENLTVEEEDRLLAGFFERAGRGRVLVVAEVKAAYEKAVGRPVPKSTVYRMLSRHGWRKIAPRPRHPLGDPAEREAFKKNSRSSSPRRSSGKPRKGGPSA
jgi:transposase